VSTKRLELFMGPDHAGTVNKLGGGKLAFDYNPRYAELSSATPISVSMPKQVPSHPDGQITPWLWGLLPDSDAVLSRWARDFHVSSGSAFSLLATPVGEDCPGAVRLITPERLDVLKAPAAGLGDVEWLGDGEVARRLRDLKADNTAWLGTHHGGRFSLAGAQAKTALLLHPKNGWGAPQGATATTHILKPAIEGLDDHDLNEHLCLSAMRAAGLRAARSRIQRFEDQSAIVVTRYDRASVNGAQVRVHQEDICQALGLHPTMKYQNEGGPGPKEIAALFRRVMPREDAIEATRSFLKALLWNWVIAGTDAHAKNYSLVLNQKQVRLAPFYDVASALPYDIAIQKQRLAMKFGSSHNMNPLSSPWARLAADMNLTEDEVRIQARGILESAPDAFSSAASDPGVQSLNSALPARLIDLVSTRVLDCEQLLV
jgi:serine/threonine-protein kinase HipA